MERLIKKINENVEIVFDKGRFDAWCVYVKRNNSKIAPQDRQYFNFFKELGNKYSKEKVYKDFVKIYDLVSFRVEKEVTDLIINIAENDYDELDWLDVKINFTVVYAGMIAEKNKEGTVLKERIKRLGMHQLLMLNYNPEVAANFSKGRKAKDLDIICKGYGF